ncbi:MAG: hypothetical protein ACK5GJ_04460, partial [Planctomycetota bacterium]
MADSRIALESLMIRGSEIRTRGRIDAWEWLFGGIQRLSIVRASEERWSLGSIEPRSHGRRLAE